jgi:predicted Zn-ribbon and HTH transcriptional regulator
MNFKDCAMETKLLSELEPASYNPRVMPESAKSGLAASIDRFGFLIPIVWNKRSGHIVGGHQRYRYLLENGATETSVVVVDLPPQEEIALNITLNNKEIRGQYTEEVIAQLRMEEARLGNVFGELALVELHNDLMKKLKPKKKKEKLIPDETPEDGFATASGPVAIITCPACKSKWSMSDNKVIENTQSKKGKSQNA